MKPCCLSSAGRYLKKNRDVATCDQCKFLLMAYAQSRDYDEAVKNLMAWGGEFSTGEVNNLRVVSKARSQKRRV